MEFELIPIFFSDYRAISLTVNFFAPTEIGIVVDPVFSIERAAPELTPRPFGSGKVLISPAGSAPTNQRPFKADLNTNKSPGAATYVAPFFIV